MHTEMQDIENCRGLEVAIMARKENAPIRRITPGKGPATNRANQSESVMRDERGTDTPPREAGSKGGEAPPPEESIRAQRGSHSTGKLQGRRRYETKE